MTQFYNFILLCFAGNSNSVANLVENENPTSTQSTVPANDDILANVDSDHIENLTPFNNLKGSYNNLFCDNLDDEMVHTMDDTENSTVMAHKTTPVKQLLENVYCNVSTPSSYPIPLSASFSSQYVAKMIGDTSISPVKTDPNLHVYSNINDTIAADVMKGSATCAAGDPSFANIESIISESMNRKSSTMLSDDLELDLDDPTTAVSSTMGGSVTRGGGTNTMPKLLKSTSSDLVKHQFGSLRKLNTSQSQDTTTTDMKTMLSAAAATQSKTKKSKKLYADAKHMTDSSAAANQTTVSDNGPASFSGQRLRTLHDTTMIDTALDLDSLN